MKKNYPHYPRVVEWSQEDGCYVGTSPGLLLGGVHGDSPLKVASLLETAIQDALDILKQQQREIPKAISTKEFSGKFVLRVPQALHQMLALRAASQGISLNSLCEQVLRQATGLSYVAENPPIAYSAKNGQGKW